MMKTCFVVGSLAGGGAERVVSILANEMYLRGNEIQIILMASNNIVYPINNGIKIVDCSQHFSVPGISFLKRVLMIRRALLQFKPDCILSFTVAVNIYSILACLCTRLKLVICERNDPRFDPVDKKTRALRSLLYNHAEGYVFQTTGERDFFSEKIRRRSAVIPNPINDKLPEPYDGVRKKRIVSVARLTAQKNYTVAIDGFKVFWETHKDYIYDVYGDGPMREELCKYCIERGVSDNVVFHGNVSDIYEQIKDAKMFLLSSDYEGLSNSMLEAMAMGILTISTDYPSGGARDFIINGVNGYLFPVGDSSKLAEILTVAADVQQNEHAVLENVRILKGKLNVKNVVDRWMDYIISI